MRDFWRASPRVVMREMTAAPSSCLLSRLSVLRHPATRARRRHCEDSRAHPTPLAITAPSGRGEIRSISRLQLILIGGSRVFSP